MSVQDDVDLKRRDFLVKLTTGVGAVGAAFVAVPFLKSWLPSQKAQALGAPVEVDTKRLEPGAQLTVPWRGKPIWIIRRTAPMLETLTKLQGHLRDPQSELDQQPVYCQNPTRALRDEFLVVVGLCTHLGCVPTYRPDVGGIDAQWLGGFYCPCHGSKYDLAGRVYKGVPAPSNLVVPPHHYRDHILVIGEDPV